METKIRMIYNCNLTYCIERSAHVQQVRIPREVAVWQSLPQPLNIGTLDPLWSKSLVGTRLEMRSPYRLPQTINSKYWLVQSLAWNTSNTSLTYIWCSMDNWLERSVFCLISPVCSSIFLGQEMGPYHSHLSQNKYQEGSSNSFLWWTSFNIIY